MRQENNRAAFRTQEPTRRSARCYTGKLKLVAEARESRVGLDEWHPPCIIVPLHCFLRIHESTDQVPRHTRANHVCSIRSVESFLQRMCSILSVEPFLQKKCPWRVLRCRIFSVKIAAPVLSVGGTALFRQAGIIRSSASLGHLST